MSMDCKLCENYFYHYDAIIIVPDNNKTKIHSTILTRVVDLEYNLKYYDLNEEMIKELKSEVIYLFDKGCKNISLVKSKNCSDIIILI